MVQPHGSNFRILLNIAGINQVTLLGRIGSDPRIIEKEDLRKFAIFSLALNESYRNVRTGRH